LNIWVQLQQEQMHMRLQAFKVQSAREGYNHTKQGPLGQKSF
jgi:hypothetical protein